MHSRRQVPIKSFDTSPSFVRLIVIASVINARGDRRRRFNIIYCRHNNIVPAIYYASCMEHATSLARARATDVEAFIIVPTAVTRWPATTAIILFFLRLCVWISFSGAAAIIHDSARWSYTITNRRGHDLCGFTATPTSDRKLLLASCLDNYYYYYYRPLGRNHRRTRVYGSYNIKIPIDFKYILI